MCWWIATKLKETTQGAHNPISNRVKVRRGLKPAHKLILGGKISTSIPDGM